MKRFQGKSLFPEATERAKTYLEKMGFVNMPHPNPMPAIAVAEEEMAREALMAKLEGQIKDITSGKYEMLDGDKAKLYCGVHNIACNEDRQCPRCLEENNK